MGHGKKKPPCACRALAKNLPLTVCGFVSGCEALELCGRAVFLFDYQRVKK